MCIRHLRTVTFKYAWPICMIKYTVKATFIYKIYHCFPHILNSYNNFEKLHLHKKGANRLLNASNINFQLNGITLDENPPLETAVVRNNV